MRSCDCDCSTNASWIYAIALCCRIDTITLHKTYIKYNQTTGPNLHLVPMLRKVTDCLVHRGPLCGSAHAPKRLKGLSTCWVSEITQTQFLEFISHKHNLSTKSCAWAAYLLLSHCAGLSTAKPLWKKPLHILNCFLIRSRCYMISLPTIWRYS